MKPMLAKTYDGGDPTGWLMSEKLDGVRAIWTGSQLISRANNPFHAPEWFTAQLPSGAMLDGELYIGRGKFQSTVGIVRKHVPVDAEWRQIRYCVFDTPDFASYRFDYRLGFCKQALEGCPVAEVVEHIPCLSMSHFERFYTGLCSAGAEGIMLRKVDSAYEQKRSANLLKMPLVSEDEAVVTGYKPGTKKYAGMVGSLICEWKDKIIKVGGLNPAVRTNPPKIGARITFCFRQLYDSGMPRIATLKAVRNYE